MKSASGEYKHMPNAMEVRYAILRKKEDAN